MKPFTVEVGILGTTVQTTPASLVDVVYFLIIRTVQTGLGIAPLSTARIDLIANRVAQIT